MNTTAVHLVSQTVPASAKPTRWLIYQPLWAFPAACFLLRSRMQPWQFMWMLSFALLAALKWLTWREAHSRASCGVGRSIVYLVAWPGMDAERFLTHTLEPGKPQLTEWLWAGAKTGAGVLMLWDAARLFPADYPLLRAWAGMLGLILLLHFGSFHLIALCWQSSGVSAQPIMNRPILSRSLGEFWGKRWNLGFRQLAHEFIFEPLHRRIGASAAGFLVFVASGLIHDLVISVPARGGYGLPTLYFALQGMGVLLERSRIGVRMGLRSGLPGRIFTIGMTAAPAFWLFHPAFALRVILPFMKAIHAL